MRGIIQRGKATRCSTDTIRQCCVMEQAAAARYLSASHAYTYTCMPHHACSLHCIHAHEKMRRSQSVRRIDTFIQQHTHHTCITSPAHTSRIYLMPHTMLCVPCEACQRTAASTAPCMCIMAREQRSMHFSLRLLLYMQHAVVHMRGIHDTHMIALC